MRPQTIVYSLTGLLLLASSFLNADGIENNRSGQDSVHKDSKLQQSTAEQPASEEPAAKSVDVDKGAKQASGEQAEINDMQDEFNKFRETTWDDQYRY